MKNNNTTEVNNSNERYYEWNVENFDKLKFHEISPIFLTGKYKWYNILYFYFYFCFYII